MGIDKLLLAIVQGEDAGAATRALNQAGLMVTHISSRSGFLRANNVTLLIGLPSSDVTRAIDLLKAHCHARTVRTARVDAPTEATVGGATVFVLPLVRYVRVDSADAVESLLSSTPPGTRQWILAIVAHERAGELLKALTDWSYRATLISTTGGFWKRGNATIFIGARSERVDSIIDQIRRVCQVPDRNHSTATVFVLDMIQYARMD